MATAMTIESWQETALLTLVDGTTCHNFALITESFELNTGEKSIEGLATVSGGRIVKWTPEGDTEFTAKIVPIATGFDDATSMEGFWVKFQPQSLAGGGTVTGNPTSVFNRRFRKTYGVSILQTSGTYPSNATLANATGSDAQRLSMRNSYITSLKQAFGTSDGLTGDVTIKCPAFNKTGNSNVQFETTAAGASAVLAVLSWANA